MSADNGTSVDVAGVPAEEVVARDAAGIQSVEHRNVEGVLWRGRGAFLNHSPPGCGSAAGRLEVDVPLAL